MYSLLGLSLATGPFLISILLLRFLADVFHSFGQMGEEIFRAEQLPLLYLANFEDKADY
ncbi:hypothetical protein Xen7305DRAFT_00011710 [Xenococcus sp. PCC 7305]|uniref:hypothetical protein n=1 Tax=Xenococcus sp. PCC 7305 TaxID=102125 RepID=UPI0002AC55FC|nr:hypothetical protein [Xenococcus sp. PCC 7305]ELS01467.1 hypothetical protein Xen7305DRAFT_00011710 [Xenococcus sp. PCC 7305]